MAREPLTARALADLLLSAVLFDDGAHSGEVGLRPGVGWENLAAAAHAAAEIRDAPPSPVSAAEATLRERVEALAKEWGEKATTYDEESAKPSKNDDERRTALAKFIGARVIRDCANQTFAALRSLPESAPPRDPEAPHVWDTLRRVCSCGVPGCDGTGGARSATGAPNPSEPSDPATLDPVRLAPPNPLATAGVATEAPAAACPKCSHSSTTHGAYSCWIKGCECGMHVAPNGEWCKTTVPLDEHVCPRASPRDGGEER